MKLSWIWQAMFYDGDEVHTITQPEDDRYSKHDDSAEWNPSSYRDFLDYFEEHKDELKFFNLGNLEKLNIVSVNFVNRKHPRIEGYGNNYLGELDDAQPIYYRQMQNTAVNGVFGEPKVVAYVVGYQGKDKNGRNIQRTLRIPA